MWQIVVSYFIGLLYINRFTDNLVIKFLPTLLLFFTGYRIYIKNRALNKFNDFKVVLKNKFLLFLCFILLIGLIRNNNPTTTVPSIIITSLFFCGFIYFIYQVIVLIGHLDSKLKYIFRFLILPYILFFAANLLFWLAGIDFTSNEGDTTSKEGILLGFLGIHSVRVKFVFASGINSYATLLGGIFTLILVYLFILKYRNWYIWFSFFITLVTILLTDSRSAFIYPFLITYVIFLYVKSSKLKFLSYWPYIIIIGPFLMTLLFPILSNYDFFSFLSRSSEDLITGNARFFIWVIALNEFLSFKILHLFGYGVYGHFASGASISWSNFFVSFNESSELVHPHNSALSILFDYGYLGLISFYIVILKICNLVKVRFRMIELKPVALIQTAFIIYLSLISITESFFGFYYLNTIYYCISFFFFCSIVTEKISEN